MKTIFLPDIKRFRYFVILPFFVFFVYSGSAKITYTSLLPNIHVTVDSTYSFNFFIPHDSLFIGEPGTFDIDLFFYYITINCWDSCEVLSDKDTLPMALDKGIMINSLSGLWHQSSYADLNSLGISGNWIGTVNQYLGLRTLKNGTWHYGWARLDIDSNATSFTLKDYAYEDAVGYGILSGATVGSYLGSISGTVFNDKNKNGIKDTNEPGLTNWKIMLNGKKFDSAFTDANGTYSFNSLLAGYYIVSESVQNGWNQTLPSLPGTYSITLADGQLVTGKDFGNNQPVVGGSISGMVFYDKNGNGIKDANETGLPNWRIRITGAKADSLLTDQNGNYIFTNLQAGNYNLSEALPSGWLQTMPSSPGSYNITLNAAQQVTTKDFGNVRVGKISGTVFDDKNGDLVKEASEPVLVNWKIKLTGTKTDSVLTDINGDFTFSNLLQGNYTVSEEIKSDWKVTLPVSGNYTFILDSGEFKKYIDFGNNNSLSVAGGNDLNGFMLKQNYPNPFNNLTVIEYQIYNPGLVQLKLYNYLGSEIQTLVDSFNDKGIYKVTLLGYTIEPGAYFFRITCNEFEDTRSMILLK